MPREWVFYRQSSDRSFEILDNSSVLSPPFLHSWCFCREILFLSSHFRGLVPTTHSRRKHGKSSKSRICSDEIKKIHFFCFQRRNCLHIRTSASQCVLNSPILEQSKASVFDCDLEHEIK